MKAFIHIKDRESYSEFIAQFAFIHNSVINSFHKRLVEKSDLMFDFTTNLYKKTDLKKLTIFFQLKIFNLNEVLMDIFLQGWQRILPGIS